MYKEVKKCLICGNDNLVTLINLGDMALTGVFPASETQTVDKVPAHLVRCMPRNEETVCGLVQLKHIGDFSQMYGMNYGYRSGLNQSMVKHLQALSQEAQSRVSLRPGDLVIDIGSNDSTLLQTYPKSMSLVGVDPSGVKFKEYYPAHVTLIPDFFPSPALSAKVGLQKAKIITSIAMFYDLENPQAFMDQVSSALADDGVWIFEQSYMPLMLEANAFDTICQEHLEYYGLKQIKWMADRAGLKIIGVSFNDSNGGSFRVTAAKVAAPYPEATELIEEILKNESATDGAEPFNQFSKRVESEKAKLIEFLLAAKAEGRKVFGYGASTKGNVLLQYYGLNRGILPKIAEVNEKKFGCYTPGTQIPIVSESEARASKPDYFVVLPWHFKSNIINREQEFLKSGGKLVFPLPKFEIVQF